MQTRLLLSLAICLTFYSAFAQSPFRSSVTLSGGIERTQYWDLIAPHVDLGYNYYLGAGVTFNAGLGFTRLSTTNITAYPVRQKLQNIEPNAHLLFSVLPYNDRYQLQIGAGIRGIFTRVNYTPLIMVEGNQVLSADRASYRINKPALDIIARSEYRINTRYFIGLQAGCNLFSNRTQPIKIETMEQYAFFKATTGITSYPLLILHASLRVGYAF